MRHLFSQHRRQGTVPWRVLRLVMVALAGAILTACAVEPHDHHAYRYYGNHRVIVHKRPPMLHTHTHTRHVVRHRGRSPVSRPVVRRHRPHVVASSSRPHRSHHTHTRSRKTHNASSRSHRASPRRASPNRNKASPGRASPSKGRASPRRASSGKSRASSPRGRRGARRSGASRGGSRKASGKHGHRRGRGRR